MRQKLAQTRQLVIFCLTVETSQNSKLSPKFALGSKVEGALALPNLRRRLEQAHEMPEGEGSSVVSSVPLMGKTKARVYRADLGDGYSQRSGDGINSINRTLPATFSVLPDAEAAALISFFEERAGYKPLLWTLPREATARKGAATEWDKTYGDAGGFNVSATIEEVFYSG